MLKPILALHCPLQVEYVNSDNNDSDDDPLALSLRSLCLLSSSRTLSASYCDGVQSRI